MISKEANSGALEAMTAAIKKVGERRRGAFDGLLGSLPDGSAVMLADILAWLRQYLLDERGLSEKQIRRIGAGLSAPQRWREDEGVRVALGVLSSISSALGLSNREKVTLLLSGKDGVRGVKVREGGARRGADIQQQRSSRVAFMQAAVDEAAREYPNWSYRELAKHAGKRLRCDERTVRRNTQNPRMRGSNRGTSS